MAIQASITASAHLEGAEPPIDTVGALLANAMLAAVLRRPRDDGGAVPARTPGKPAPSAAAALELALA
jgi:hypothetical protein